MGDIHEVDEQRRRDEVSADIQKSSGEFVDAQLEVGVTAVKLLGPVFLKVLLVIAIIILFLPVVLSAIICGSFKLLSKTKMFGRIVQSTLMGFLFGFTITVAFIGIYGIINETMPALGDVFLTMGGIAGIIMGLIGTLWYFFSNYFHVKAKDWIDFTLSLSLSLAIIYYPFAALVILSGKAPEYVILIVTPISILIAVILYIWNLSKKRMEKKLIGKRKYLKDTLAQHPNDDGWYNLWNCGYPSQKEFKEAQEEKIADIENEIKTSTEEKAQGKKALIPAILSLALTFFLSLSIFNGLQDRMNFHKRTADSTLIFYTSARNADDTDFNMYAEPNVSADVIKKLKNGDKMNATGGFVRRNNENGNVDFVEIDLDGTTGWVDSRVTYTILGTATVISENATWEHRDASGRYVKSPIPNGTEVYELRVNKKKGITEIFFNGELGDIPSVLITSGDPSQAELKSGDYIVKDSEIIRIYVTANKKRALGTFSGGKVIKTTGLTDKKFTEVFTEGAYFFDQYRKPERGWVETRQLNRNTVK